MGLSLRRTHVVSLLPFLSMSCFSFLLPTPFSMLPYPAHVQAAPPLLLKQPFFIPCRPFVYSSPCSARAVIESLGFTGIYEFLRLLCQHLRRCLDFLMSCNPPFNCSLGIYHAYNPPAQQHLSFHSRKSNLS